MTALNNKVVAITGAGSGIGRALALNIAKRGGLLAISDRNLDGLAETESLVKAAVPGVSIRTDDIDVSNETVVSEWADAIVADFGRVNVIVNNAGVAFSGDIAESTLKDLEWVMGINFWGVVHGSTAFLPHLTRSGEGHIVNLSSLFGLVAIPSQSQYNASKFAVRGWSESLREELLITNKAVKVSVVHPGGVKTGIARNARAAEGLDAEKLAAFFDKNLAKMTPEKAAEIIVSGVEKNKGRILVGADAYALASLERLFGGRYENLIAFGTKKMGAFERARRA